MLRADLGLQRSALEWYFFCSKLWSHIACWDAKGTGSRSRLVSLMI